MVSSQHLGTEHLDRQKGGGVTKDSSGWTGPQFLTCSPLPRSDDSESPEQARHSGPLLMLYPLPKSPSLPPSPDRFRLCVSPVICCWPGSHMGLLGAHPKPRG